MRFRLPSSERTAEPVVPMINVVFLLLVFFMMASQIAPPAPVEITLPLAEPEAAAIREAVLYLSRDGRPLFDGYEGELAWQAISALPPDQILTIAADEALPVADLARLLSRITPDRPVELLVQP